MKLKLLLPAVAVAASLVFAGCKEGHDHDHDHDHDHSHEHGDHKDGDAAKGGEPDAEPAAAAMPDSADAKPVAAKDGVKAYPLETCIVAGSKLGSMGEPTVLVYEGQEVKFCCESCEPKFKADPAKYLAKLTVAKD